MKKEVKVAIIVAVITGAFGLIGPEKQQGVTINGNQNIVAEVMLWCIAD
jgi:hypothetical protein